MLPLREQWNQWNFAKRIYTVTVMAISFFALVAITVSTGSFVSTVTRQNRERAAEQLAYMTKEYETNLEQYKAAITSIVMNSNVQNYCNGTTQTELYNETQNIYSFLQSILYMQRDINFIAVVNDKLDTYIYSGNRNMTGSNFENAYELDYQDSILAKGTGTLRMSTSNNYFYGSQYTLTLYFPLYSLTNMVSSNGMIIINLDDSVFNSIGKQGTPAEPELYFLDNKGNLVYSANTGRIGEQPEFFSSITAGSGSFWYQGKLINYQRIGGWNYYLIDEIPGWYLYQNCVSTVVVLLLVMLATMVGVLFVIRSLTHRLFQPINTVIEKMNDASHGNLKTRIDTSSMDVDGLKLADGFNIMMEDIANLLSRVKAEQHQLDIMKFNALQSQIQPHFLYNTLECIHWQAVSEGNREVSTMVKALAQYYRVCLSKGKDIIPLEKELEQIKNYLIIQNIRYDNIIRLEQEILPTYFDLPIPKLTLQPLIENSIYHGIRVKEGRSGVIRLTVREEADAVVLVVSDNGAGMTEEETAEVNRSLTGKNQEIGYGIVNVNKRVELIFGAQYGLNFRQNEAGGVDVEIRLPKPGDPAAQEAMRRDGDENV
jgi:two-component system sensor histidine kinase YesM